MEEAIIALLGAATLTLGALAAWLHRQNSNRDGDDPKELKAAARREGLKEAKVDKIAHDSAAVLGLQSDIARAMQQIASSAQETTTLSREIAQSNRHLQSHMEQDQEIQRDIYDGMRDTNTILKQNSDMLLRMHEALLRALGREGGE